ncbi:MAG: histidine phosphatase family protein, partial [Flavobacterium sp.]
MQVEKNIFLVRHAQTILNAEQVLQGQSFDSDLSNEGIIQAELFYSNFKHISFDKIYISGLRRAFDSVKRFVETKVPVEIIQELIEINWGIIEGNKFVDETKKLYLETITSWKNGDYNAKIENGESAIDVAHRLKKVVDTILRKETEKNIL